MSPVPMSGDVRRVPDLSQHALQLVSTIVIILFALTVIFVRLRASRKPTNARKLIMPPLGMSTGFLMFVAPTVRIPFLFAIAAFLAGCLFSIPLILSSHMQRVGGDIYLKRSSAFVVVLLGLLTIRLALHPYIERFITIPQTGALFFILAFGMILPWRIVMFLRYRKFAAADKAGGTPAREPSGGGF